ncbi:sensor histidine kinase [Paenibacillus thalictri]|uniref:histidine kinase n=1 Tax=Paenibacillus thalictri TaxID=2527873 RepID=A0A4Q9DX89_9BACL|nr:ATP-binding protein [Paenibacillus thalictri]TBL81734.1 sensor histidine kinase [Paenibacillus thalictri]
MSLRTLKLLTIFVPVLMIGGFEYIRHDFLLDMLSMEAGNFYITALTLVLSLLFATWMFRKIERINVRLAEEQSQRAVYEERERLAQELHDHIAQMLFFLNVQLQQGKINEARSAASEIDSHLRQAIFNLRTPPGDGSAFASRLSAWVQGWSAMTGIEADLIMDVPDGYFTVSQEVQLFGIVQEACTNIRKHSQAERAEITLRLKEVSSRPVTGASHNVNNGSGWRLSVKDDGIGMAERSPHSTGYGLTLLEKRAKELGAAFKVSSAPGQGTEIDIIGGGASHEI